MPHKLLLADDSVTIQRVIELTFADEDVQVLTAGDGEQAIRRVREDRPDIVLADIGMPKQSGYDVAAFVKADPELAHVPVLLLAGAFEPVDEARAREVRCDGVLVKPFEPQQVVARVRELLRGLGSRPAGVTRAVADVPRPAERLAAPRPVEASAGDRPAPPSEPAQQASEAAPPRDATLDEYFDRLDAAFATISPPAARAEAAMGPAELSQFDVPPPSGVHEMSSPQSPATYASPPPAFEWPAQPQQPAPEPPDSSAQRAAAAPEPVRGEPATTPVGSGSAIADAFSALLAVEQGEPVAAGTRLAVLPGPPAITDDLVEEIARRVVERLGSASVQDVVADVVRDVSERLVREEIARLRAKARS